MRAPRGKTRERLRTSLRGEVAYALHLFGSALASVLEGNFLRCEVVLRELDFALARGTDLADRIEGLP